MATTRWAVSALALLAFASTQASTQPAAPATDLMVMVLEENVHLPIVRVAVCVSPDASEPAFWGRMTHWLVPGIYRIEDIPLPPGMSGQPIVVTLARPDYQTVIEQQPLAAYVPSGGPAPGQIQVRTVRMPRGGPSSADCGTPPQDPLGPAVALMMTPNQWAASMGDRETFRLDWSRYAFAAPWYVYEWVIDDPAIAAPVAVSQGSTIEIEARAPGVTRLTAYLLRPDGSRKQSESARIEVMAARPPPPPPPPPEQYSFGWETVIDQRAANDFNLPHACAVGTPLIGIVHARARDCSIRTNPSEGCSTCHRMGAQRPWLDQVTKQQFCGMVPGFVANMQAKPLNLRNFFEDWYGRRDRATGECPD
jgi:hypothetical protein